MNTFNVCGSMPSSQIFDIPGLHPPLRDIPSDGYDETAWNANDADLLMPEASMDESVLVALINLSRSSTVAPR
jgi:hypothetical protein